MAHLNLPRSGPQRNKGPVRRAPIRRVNMTDGNTMIDLLPAINGQDFSLINTHTWYRMAIINQVREQALVTAH
ncbi:hypothetical protein IEQ34_009418 [Dendrobium chrysotoxum]|uniref:Uncharacterized protein n=1 Tax=Dendrobium chrysotoxum TaxID=161865 RepID=A0AAV7H2U0_DENCH|nr:hypothetical protein IEQ34_009418 [Dendrobium chrysotoxum]